MVQESKKCVFVHSIIVDEKSITSISGGLICGFTDETGTITLLCEGANGGTQLSINY